MEEFGMTNDNHADDEYDDDDDVDNDDNIK